MSGPSALHTLATRLGVQVRYRDGFGTEVEVGAETLVPVCRALGAHLPDPSGVADALAELDARPSPDLPPVIVAWDGRLGVPDIAGRVGDCRVALEDGATVDWIAGEDPVPELPFGYHVLSMEGIEESARVISAPATVWRPPDDRPRWGVAAHLAASRSTRSRAVGDLRDLDDLCRTVGDLGGSAVTLLPLLPTFNSEPVEPSPYSPVSRLFWSELMLDLGGANEPRGGVDRLDPALADAEVRRALERLPRPAEEELDTELIRYARFRGAQRRLGRDWRSWPNRSPDESDIDRDEERFHLNAQLLARGQLEAVAARHGPSGVSLGLDLAVGVHGDGYDGWAFRDLFAEGVSVGAPPDPGFAKGQNWGFAPVLPAASQAEGHRYFAAAVAHQARVAGLLRIDHVMALSRLFWIPAGARTGAGTYVSNPSTELFAVLCVESHRHECEIVGEDLGTVPEDIQVGMERHDVRGMSLAFFDADARDEEAPRPGRVAMVGTHDTPTFAGWLAGHDIDERLACGLMDPQEEGPARERRAANAEWLAERVGGDTTEAADLYRGLLEWLGSSEASWVLPWIEDLWLEPTQVNLPGTSPRERDNWLRPMARKLDEVLASDAFSGPLAALHESRNRDRKA